MRSSRVWKRCRSLAKSCAGQSTVEFCIVAGAFLVVLLGGWAMLKIFAGDILGQHAVYAASHALAASPAGVLADILAV